MFSNVKKHRGVDPPPSPAGIGLRFRCFYFEKHSNQAISYIYLRVTLSETLYEKIGNFMPLKT